MNIIFTILIVRIIDLLIQTIKSEESLLWTIYNSASAAIFNRDIFLSKNTKYSYLALCLYSSATQEYETFSSGLLNIEFHE